MHHKPSISDAGVEGSSIASSPYTQFVRPLGWIYKNHTYTKEIPAEGVAALRETYLCRGGVADPSRAHPGRAQLRAAREHPESREVRLVHP